MSESWAELAKRYYEKAEVLSKEAEKDEEIGAYNKAVSAHYFRVEAMANALFALKKQKTRGFAGRKALIREFFGPEAELDFMRLHELRDLADHKADILGPEELMRAKELSNKLYPMIKSRVEEELKKVGILR